MLLCEHMFGSRHPAQAHAHTAADVRSALSGKLDEVFADANGRLKSVQALYDLHLLQIAQLACLCNLGYGKLDGKAVAVHVQALQFSGPVDDVGGA